jgi:hypothetical protein
MMSKSSIGRHPVFMRLYAPRLMEVIIKESRTPVTQGTAFEVSDWRFLSGVRILELHWIVEHFYHPRFEKFERLWLEVKENMESILHDFPLLKRMKIILNIQELIECRRSKRIEYAYCPFSANTISSLMSQR